jgi:hypothetical protein
MVIPMHKYGVGDKLLSMGGICTSLDLELIIEVDIEVE